MDVLIQIKKQKKKNFFIKSILNLKIAYNNYFIDLGT